MAKASQSKTTTKRIVRNHRRIKVVKNGSSKTKRK